MSDRRVTLSLSPRWILAIIGLVIAGLIIWATAPWSFVHWFLFDVFWMHPTGWALIVIAVIIFIAIYAANHNEYNEPGAATWIVGILLTIGLIGYGILSPALARQYLIQGLQPTALETLPETTEVRYLPMPVAERYGANQIQDPAHHLGDMDPLDTGGEIDWVAPLVPTGTWNWLTGQTDGFVIITPDGESETIHQPMRYGEGMAITDNITWQLWRIHYNVDLPEFYYIRSGDEVLAIAPYVAYRYQFPVRVPYWGGVFVVHANGLIEDLSPEAAVADPRFEGQRLYPEALALRIAKAWEFRGGISNAWFTHRDQTEVPHIDGEDNQMPYLIPTDQGPMWFVGMEPYGPAYSIFKILFVDAHDGSLRLYELPAESGMMSPNRAGGYVRAAFPTYQWYQKSENSSGNLFAIEPRPLTRDGVLYWQMSITNIDYAGVTQTVLVNAGDNSVVYFENLEEIERFLDGTFAGRNPTGVPQQSATGPAPQVSPSSDLNGMSDEELWALLEQVLTELRSR